MARQRSTEDIQQDHRSTALRTIKAAEGDHQQQLVETANQVAESVLETGGVTKQVGIFTLAMHGFDGLSRVGMQANPQGRELRTFYEHLHDRFNYQRASRRPVARFMNDRIDRPEAIGYIPPVDPGYSPLQYRIEKRRYPSRPLDQYVGKVILPVFDLHAAWQSDTTVRATQRLAQAEIELIQVQRDTDDISDCEKDGIVRDNENQYALGYHEIVQHHRFGISLSSDTLFLSRISGVLDDFRSYDHLTTERGIRQAAIRSGAVDEIGTL